MRSIYSLARLSVSFKLWATKYEHEPQARGHNRDQDRLRSMKSSTSSSLQGSQSGLLVANDGELPSSDTEVNPLIYQTHPNIYYTAQARQIILVDAGTAGVAFASRHHQQKLGLSILLIEAGPNVSVSAHLRRCTHV
jgi:hypothetical protein